MKKESIKNIKRNSLDGWDAIYEELAPNKGEVLYSIMIDDYEMFSKYYKKHYKFEKISDSNFFDLLIESNAFNCILYMKKYEKSFFKEQDVSRKKEILKRLFISSKKNNDEIDLFLKNFLSIRLTENEKVELYITALIFAPTIFFNKYFAKNYKFIENKHLSYIINIFENNDVLSTNAYKETNRLHLIYDEFLKIGKKRSINWLHFANATYLGNETEIFRNKFFAYLPNNEKLKWVKYLFKSRNLVYHGTVLCEEIKEKYKNKKEYKNEKALNLEFVIFIIDDILGYIKKNQVKLTIKDIKKFKMFIDTLTDISNNVFLFQSIIAFNDLNNYIHEWELKNKISKSEKENFKIVYDRKRKKI